MILWNHLNLWPNFILVEEKYQIRGDYRQCKMKIAFNIILIAKVILNILPLFQFTITKMSSKW